MDVIWKLLPFTREPSFLEKAWMAARYPIDLIASPVRALVSIPALSFLVIPAFSSYGTSVNLALFYLTWAILIRSNDPVQIELFGTLGIRALFYIFPSLVFLAFDTTFPSSALRVKEYGGLALPMAEKRERRRGPWTVLFVSIANVIMSVALQISLELLTTRMLHLRSLLKISTTVPFPWTIARDLFFGLTLREILVYILHRYMLHSDNSKLSSLHESWQHSIRLPFSMVAHYDHPIAYTLHIFVPMYLPAILLRFHILTYQLYLILISLEDVFAYSGYNMLPNAFILGGIARRREKHFLANGDGNYGCFGLTDLLMGTSLGIDLVDDAITEVGYRDLGKTAQPKPRDARQKALNNMPQRAFDDEEKDEEAVDRNEPDKQPRVKPPSSFKQSSPRNKTEKDGKITKAEQNDDDESPVRKSGRTQRSARKPTNNGETKFSEEEVKSDRNPNARRGSRRSRGDKQHSEVD
ncbi:hypothetical protein ACLMJK_004193 [Lecanora helva]